MFYNSQKFYWHFCADNQNAQADPQDSIAPDKAFFFFFFQPKIYWYFSYLSTKMYVVGTH